MADTNDRLDPSNLFFSTNGRYRCSTGPHQPLLQYTWPLQIFDWAPPTSSSVHMAVTDVRLDPTNLFFSTHDRYRCSTGPHQPLLQYTWPLQVFDWTPPTSSSVHMTVTGVRLDPTNLFFSTHDRYRCSTGPRQPLLQYTWPLQVFDWTPPTSSSVHMAVTDVRLDPTNLFFSTHGRYRCSTGPHQPLLQYT